MIKIWQTENLFFSKSGEFGPIFFMENPLYKSKSYFFRSKFWQEKKKHCLSKCVSSAVSQLRSWPFLCSPLILHWAHEANGGRIYALESGMYALAFGVNTVPASTRFAPSLRQLTWWLLFLFPWNPKLPTQTLKNFQQRPSKPSTAHSVPVFFFSILGISPSGPSCTFCGARMAISLELQLSGSTSSFLFRMWLLAKIGGVKYLASLPNLVVEVFG